MLTDTVVRLSSISNIVGIKEATGDIERAWEIIERCGDSMDVISGDDATSLELLLAGGKGTISVTANVAPKLMAEMCAAAMSGEAEAANRINRILDPLHRNLFLEANPIPVKWALVEMGMIPAGIRLPLTPLSEPYRDTLRKVLRGAGLGVI